MLPGTRIFSRISNTPANDLDRLTGLKALSWLSTAELALLARTAAVTHFKESKTIFRAAALLSDAHILSHGIARITCRSARARRVTIALIPAGPIPQFPSLPISQFDFQCEAYSDCRVASLSWSDFGRIAGLRSGLAYKTFHQNDLKQWYQVLLRTSGFLGLRERIAIALLELASDFGIKESRGELLRISPSHQDLADLVGASRPRITEHLAQFEREHLIIRQGRQLIVRVDAMEDAIKPTGRGFHCLSVGARRNRSSSSLYPEAAPSVESIAAQAGIQPLA